MNARQCQAVTRKGCQCREKGVFYIRFKGREYLTCKRHNTFEFRPYQKVIEQALPGAADKADA